MKTLDLTNEVDLDKLIANLERELEQRKRDLETAKRFRDALPRLTAAEGAPSKKPPAAVQMPLNGAGLSDEYGATTKAVRKAIQHSPTDYTIYDVERNLSQNGVELPRTQISQILSRLVRAREVHVKHRGSGRRPSIFTKDEH